jgi:hypothetical protein
MYAGGHTLPPLRQTPTLADWIDKYLAREHASQTKSPLTLKKEVHTLREWSNRLGTIRIAHLGRAEINDFVQARKEGGASNRTVNLDVIALNNCLKKALHEGKLDRLPTETWSPLKHVTPRRPLWTAEQINWLCCKAMELEYIKRGTENRQGNGELLVDFIPFLVHSGARHDEAVHERFMEKILYQRNERMLERVRPYLEQGDTFIAVGALHLPDKRGLLEMLEQEGHTLTVVY